MQSALTRKQRIGRLWQLRLVVLLRSTRWCTTIAPPTHLVSHSSTHTNVSNSTGLLAHLSANTSRHHLRLYLHLRLCCACLHHRPLELPPPHLLQLWSLRPLCLRVPRAKEECHSGPRHSSILWSIEGDCCKDRSRQLHHCGGHSRGRASTHR
jgi:hypothetical protein